MSSSQFLILANVPFFIICVVGTFCFIEVGRRLRIPIAVSYLLAFFILFLYLCTQENMMPPVRRLLPREYRTAWIPSLAVLWNVIAIATAALLAIRSRVSGFKSDRRTFLSQSLQSSTVALCAAPAIILSAGTVLRKNFEIKEVDVHLPNLPKDLQGLRLLQLSDIHVGDFFTPRDVARIVDASNNLRPDLAFITGDLITTERDPLDACLLELRRLKTSSGIWGCMGNHEEHSGIEADVKLKAARLGIQFLRQKAELLRFGQHHVNLVGVDYQRPALPYLSGVDELVDLSVFNLLLSHNPDVFPQAAEKGFDLTLAGHTHGGQLNLELFGQNLNVAEFFTPYTKGLYTLPTSSIYVNAGLGTIGIPTRIGAPPEITLIRLCNS